ncbi:hypothetical protein [Streptococcus sp. sy004]|uniref:hypothetical protein n=1 Tax=Streptococcus sp. sy004 TaxID=2600149 RepID=UPI0011B6DE46|nr:hypothetical protein [Streptococcus sp. sy004]TWT10369.1 hypothetical protein FRX54_05310 [Streptococcus sp. sy004]
MNREDILEYLLEKRQIVAPVEKARLHLEKVKSNNPNIDFSKIFLRCLGFSVLLTLVFTTLLGLFIELLLNIFVSS